MNRFLLQLAAMKEVAQAPADADVKNNRFAAGQKLVVDSTQAMLDSFVKKEKAASEYRHPKADEIVYERYTALVNELLSGYGNMDSDHLHDMAWISPVLLSSCIRSKNEDIRLVSVFLSIWFSCSCLTCKELVRCVLKPFLTLSSCLLHFRWYKS